MRYGFAALARGFFVAAFAMMANAASAATYLYVGNAASNEIFVFSLDPKTGDLTAVDKLTVPGITKAGSSMPMAVSPNKKLLYAGFRGEPQVAATFSASSSMSETADSPIRWPISRQTAPENGCSALRIRDTR